jgi:hypothetical protein
VLSLEGSLSSQLATRYQREGLKALVQPLTLEPGFMLCLVNVSEKLIKVTFKGEDTWLEPKQFVTFDIRVSDEGYPAATAYNNGLS